MMFFFFFSSRRRHTRWPRDWSSDVCSSDLKGCRRWWPWWIGHGIGYPQGVLGVTCTRTYQHPYPQPQMKTHGKTRPLIQPWFGSQIVVSRKKKEIDSGHTEMAQQNTSSWFKTWTTRRVSPSLFKMPPKTQQGGETLSVGLNRPK